MNALPGRDEKPGGGAEKVEGVLGGSFRCGSSALPESAGESDEANRRECNHWGGENDQYEWPEEQHFVVLVLVA